MKKITLLFYLFGSIINSQINFEFEDLSNLMSKRGLIPTVSNANYLFVSNDYTPEISCSTDI